MPLRFALSPSGGLAYHIIAFRRSHRAWKPFRARIRGWLGDWRKDPARELIVFGPSAGWTLPLELLAHANKLTIIEPDPIARVILKSRLIRAGARKETIEWIADPEILPWFSSDTKSFSRFLDERPRADILFANVLGQIPLHVSPKADETAATQARKTFLDSLSSRRWASYHDLASGPSQFCADHAGSLAAGEKIDLARIFSEGTVTDHETSWISDAFHESETELALWRLTESQTHVIAFNRKF